MIRNTIVSLTLAGAVALSGCATPDRQHEEAGMVIGGVLGGLLGTQVGSGRGREAAIIAGTLVGAAIGGNVGRSMDELDRLKTAQTLETVRTGIPSVWVNPDTGHQYSVMPTRTYDTATGPCREYTVDAIIGGQRETIYGTACRQPDGSWQVLN
jgi:surface antigen